MPHASRRLLGTVAGLLLMATLTPVHAAVAAPAAATGHRPQPDMSHRQAVAALRQAQALASGGRGGRSAPGRGIDATPVLRNLAVALPSLHRAQRRTAKRILARPTDPGGDFPGQQILTLDPTKLYKGEIGDTHFDVHFISTGDYPTDPNAAEPTWVQGTVLPALERAWATEVGALGYRQPLADTGNPGDPGNPDSRLDVYLGDIGSLGIYGYCTTTDPASRAGQQPGYCVLDNDFAASQFPGNPTDAMHATIAHEFFHAVQFGYDAFEDLWFMEGTAVWMEHQVYPGTRDFLQYLPVSAIAQPGVPVDKFDDYEYHQYGAFVFWEYLSERFGRKAVRDVWQRAAVHRESNPYSLQAARREVAAHGQDFTSFFAGFARWNTLPAHSYAMHNAYAARVRPPWGLTHTFSRSRPRMAARQTTLKHLSSSNVRFRPAPTLGRKARLRILLDLPNRSHGPAASVQVHHQDGSVGWRRVRLSRTGAARATVPFNPRKVRDVVVVLSNTSTRMVSCSTTSGTYSCGGHGAYDSNQAYRISARLR